MTNEDLTRRTLFRASALAGLAALLDACSSRALSTGDPDASPDAPALDASNGGDAPGADAGPDADIAALNALLAAEYETLGAYDFAAGVVTDASSSDPLIPLQALLAVILMNWQGHHREHSAQLAAAVSAAGGTPVRRSVAPFARPAGFTPTILNALRLVCNTEKAAVIAYGAAVGALGSAERRFLASSVAGDDAQHFAVLYALLNGAVALDPAVVIADNNVNNIVPRAFTSRVGTGTNGLESVADFTFA